MIDVVPDPFFASVQHEGDVSTGGGQTMPLPLRYFDTGSFSGRFLADADAVRAALPSGRLKPVEAEPGRAVVLLVAYDHRQTDLGHYRELAVWLLVTEERDGRTGLSCLLLPVDSEAAYAAGVEMAGFPKFLAALTIEASPTVCRCEVSADGRAIVTLIVTPGAPGEAARAGRTRHLHRARRRTAAVLRAACRRRRAVGGQGRRSPYDRRSPACGSPAATAD